MSKSPRKKIVLVEHGPDDCEVVEITNTSLYFIGQRIDHREVEKLATQWKWTVIRRAPKPAKQDTKGSDHGQQELPI